VNLLIEDRRRNLPPSSERIDDIYIRSLARESLVHEFHAEYTRATAEINALKKHKVAWTVEHGRIVPYDVKIMNEEGELIDLYPAYSENVLFKQKRNRTSKKETQLIDWSLPGQDHESAKYKHCGHVVYIPTNEMNNHESSFDSQKPIMPSCERTSIIASCEKDHDHYAKAKKHCCYQLSCPRCWNDTALRRARAAEIKILSHKYLSIKRERTIEQKTVDRKDLTLSHWVLSFHVDSGAVNMARTVRGFNKLRDIAKSLLVEAGMKGGAMVFHPWRWNSKTKQWDIGPHFHIIGYGWLNTKSFQQKFSPSINLIKVHEHEEIRSTFLTVAYLLTHTGIARIPKRDEDIDWSKRFVAQMKRFWKMKEIRQFDESSMFKDDTVRNNPEQSSINLDMDNFISSFLGEQTKLLSGDTSLDDFFHDDDDPFDDSEELIFGPDQSFESPTATLNGFNWKQFVLGAYTQKFQTISYFGAISTKNIRIFGVYKERVRRTCPECQSDMSLYVHDGSRLQHHEYLYYVKTSPMMCRASEYQMIEALYLKFKTDLDDDGHTLLDFARFVPYIVTLEDTSIQPWLDDDTAEFQRQLRSEVTIHFVKPSGIVETQITSKRGARELGYIEKDEICPSEIRILIGVH